VLLGATNVTASIKVDIGIIEDGQGWAAAATLVGMALDPGVGLRNKRSLFWQADQAYKTLDLQQ